MKKIAAFLMVFLSVCQSVCAMSLSFYKCNMTDSRNVKILMYHKLSENAVQWNDYCTSPKTFENDIIYFKNNGYEFMTADMLSQYKNNSNKKIAVITFDDGYMSDFSYALKILEKYDVCATFFITGSLIGTNEYMDKESLLKLSESKNVQIGNHSYSLHQKTPNEINAIYRFDEKSSVLDFMKNNEFLESITGKKITALSYPNGIFTSEINGKLKKIGIDITFSTDNTRYIYKSPSPTGRLNRSNNVTIEELMKTNLK